MVNSYMASPPLRGLFSELKAYQVPEDIHPHDAYLDFVDARGLEPIVVSKPVNQSLYTWEKAFHVGFIQKASG